MFIMYNPYLFLHGVAQVQTALTILDFFLQM